MRAFFNIKQEMYIQLIFDFPLFFYNSRIKKITIHFHIYEKDFNKFLTIQEFCFFFLFRIFYLWINLQR